MEIASFFTNRESDIKDFELFLNDKLKFDFKDNDTIYFCNKKTGDREIYLHFKINDTKEEFSYNYTKKEINQIKDFYKEEDFVFVDISYRDINMIRKVINSFIEKVGNNTDSDYKVLFHLDDDFVKYDNSQ